MVWSEMAVCHLGLGDDGTLAKGRASKSRVQSSSQLPARSHQRWPRLFASPRPLHGPMEYYRRALSWARQIKDPVSIKKWTRNINLAYSRVRLEIDQSHLQTV